MQEPESPEVNGQQDSEMQEPQVNDPPQVNDQQDSEGSWFAKLPTLVKVAIFVAAAACLALIALFLWCCSRGTAESDPEEDEAVEEDDAAV